MMKFPLFTQVRLAEDIPAYHLKRGEIATVVEYYPTPVNQEDGYSLEGFDLPQITLEVQEHQIEAVSEADLLPSPSQCKN